MTKKKQILLLASAIIILIAVGAFLYFRNQSNDTLELGEINYNPPTEEEANAGDDKKPELVAQQDREANSDQQSSDNSDSKKQVTVIITDADQYGSNIEVRSFIPDHYQDGTCIITISNGSDVIKKSTPAYKDASTTICTNPLFARSEFGSTGNWQVVVEYVSDSAYGKSDARSIQVS